MKAAEYPQRKCRLHVPGEFNDGTCDLPEFHDSGPCADVGIPASVRRRDEWEARNPDLAYKGVPGFNADPFAGEKKQ